MFLCSEHFEAYITQPSSPRLRLDFNKPYWQAKDYQDNDALAVECTAYALHTLFILEGGGVTMLQEQIVAWLNTMRLGDGGFIASVDTVVALQALVIYSYNSRIKDITDLSVQVDLPDSNTSTTLFFSGSRAEIAKPQRYVKDQQDAEPVFYFIESDQ